MKAFYINLDSAILRRSQMEKQISSSSLLFKLERFNAVRGQDYQIKNENLSNGQWGCWLSHLSIINSCLHDSEDLLIIEDDEYFDPMLNHVITVINELQAQEWDLLYLDLTTVEVEDYLYIARAINKKVNADLKPSSIKLPKEFTAYGTHSYVINSKSKGKVLGHLNRYINTGLPIDNVFCHGIQSGDISAFIALPLLTSPGSETVNSQINPNNHPLESSWIKFRKLASIYNIKENFDEYLQEKIEIETKEIISKRLDFSCLLKFKPLNNITKE